MPNCPKCSKSLPTAQGVRNHLPWCGKETIAERFWRYVRKQDGCWPWLGALHRDGYGRFNLPQHTGMVISHRYAWKLTHGEIPEGMDVLHRCDNPPCCNPAHLRLGTHQENMDDMNSKDRNGYAGERAFNTKLTNAQAIEIKRRFKYKSRRRTNSKELAAEYGVTDEVIYNIGTGRAWKRVTGVANQDRNRRTE